ncbi:MAG: AMP-binding protein [Anaerovoracaceae bacterium]|nr:AMP-binding protein [Anaerovoracaceae bacterium]
MTQTIKISRKLERVNPYPYLDNFRDFLDYYCSLYNEDLAFIIKEKRETKTSSAQYRYISFNMFREEIHAFSAYLTDTGYQDQPIAIIGKNSYEWFTAYMSVLINGNIAVPLDKDSPAVETISYLERSGAKTLIYDPGKESLIKEVKEYFGDKISFISMAEMPQFIEKGFGLINTGYVKHVEKEIDPRALAVILFTSGTTSASKAVMLCQDNILTVSYDCVTTEDIRRGDVNMAFLPYHHTFGSGGQVVMLNAGVTTTFCDGLKYVQRNLVEYGVSLFVCVPILMEAIYKKIIAGVKKQGKERQFAAALAVSRGLYKIGIDVRRKVFKDILDQLGGKLRFAISGASALDPEVWRNLNDFGIDLVQGYGLTEAAPVICAESTKHKRSGSCGFSMASVDTALYNMNSEGVGELIARGPNVMMGYMDNEEATNEAIRDGWLHTGDLARIDKNGFIYILGRKKNVIVLKNGKNVYPEELETLITNLPYVEEVMVFGQAREEGSGSTGSRNVSKASSNDLVVTAKIVYNKDMMKERYTAETFEDIEKVIKSAVDKINDDLPSYKCIRRLILTDQPMEKTTTGKIKRYKNKD